MAVLTYRDFMGVGTDMETVTITGHTGRLFSGTASTGTRGAAGGEMRGGGSRTRVEDNTLITTIDLLQPVGVEVEPPPPSTPPPAAPLIPEVIIRAPGTAPDASLSRGSLLASSLDMGLGGLSGGALAQVVIGAKRRPKPAPKPRPPPRRRPPPPARRGRPRRMPLPRRLPRIPIPVPALEVVRVIGARANLALTLLPIMFGIGVALDDAATRSWQARLGLLPERRKRPVAKPVVSNTPRLLEPVAPLEEVLIVGTRPVAPPSGVASLFPVGDALRLTPVSFGVGLSPLPLPANPTRPAIGPKPRPSPQPIRFPNPLGVPDALPQPFVTPLPLPEPTATPAPAPRLPTKPTPVFASPLAPTTIGSLQPLPTPEPTPVEQTEKCKCPEKKKRKKQEDRTVCHRGTYRQNSRGITYKVLEEIPCEQSATTRTTTTPGKKIGRKLRSIPSYTDVFN